MIVSNNASNQFLSRVQVVPLNGSTDRLYPSEAYVTFRRKRSKAMADQLTTMSKRRLRSKVGTVSPAEMSGIAQAISIQLEL